MGSFFQFLTWAKYSTNELCPQHLFETYPPKITDYRRNKIEAPEILKLTKTALKGVQNVQNIFLKGVRKIAQKKSRKLSKKIKIVQNVQKNIHKIVQKVDQKSSKEGQKIVKIIKKVCSFRSQFFCL